MESRLVPNLFFAGEVNIAYFAAMFIYSFTYIYTHDMTIIGIICFLTFLCLQVLNVDGVTGGFNFQVNMLPGLLRCNQNVKMPY